jgi:hypothetical protein
MPKRIFYNFEGDREFLASWLNKNFSLSDRNRVSHIFYETFDLSFREGLKDIHGRLVLVFVIQAILLEPSLGDLSEFGYSQEQIDDWAFLRRETIKEIISFPDEKIPELRTFLCDGMNLYDSISCALKI